MRGWLKSNRVAIASTGVAVVAMLLAARPTTVTSLTDAGTEPIDVSRIQIARLATGAFIMWAAVMGGVAGF